jgi:exonuclease SbcD
MAFRFVHTADIHLDSPLKSLALRNQTLAEEVETATRSTFRKIVNLCLDEDIDALLIAGDLYDGEQTSIKTAGFLSGELRRLSEAGVYVCIIRGNHDARAKITDKLDLPEKVKNFGARTAETLVIENQNGPTIAINGLSFPNRHVPENLLRKYPSPTNDAVNIGMLHTSLAGADGHDVYAPCSVQELIDHGYDYWALGHIHKRQVHSEKPFVVMPGIPQGRHINEAGPKSVTLITVGNDKSLTIEERFLATTAFMPIHITVSGSWSDARVAAESALKNAAEKCYSERLITRLYIEANDNLSWQLRRDSDLFLEELNSASGSVAWIEKIDISKSTSTPSGPISRIAELMQQKNAEIALKAEAINMLNDLVRLLPPQARDALGDSETEQMKLAEELAFDGIADALARLSTMDEDRQ